MRQIMVSRTNMHSKFFTKYTVKKIPIYTLYLYNIVIFKWGPTEQHILHELVHSGI